MRRLEGDDRRRALAYFNTAVRFTEIMFGKDYALLLRRSGEAITHAPVTAETT